jgi:hypothetical protein
MDSRRVPELFRGFQRQPRAHALSGRVLASGVGECHALLEAALGLEFDPAKGDIRLRNPRLPSILEDVTLRNLRLDSASVDLRMRRHTGAVSLDILRARGQIQVSIVCSPRESR